VWPVWSGGCAGERVLWRVRAAGPRRGDGTMYGFPRGLSKALDHQLALWCQANNVKQKRVKR